jgi:uncharacterized membrane protein YgdD (TMEM256/DUF423 family)
MKTSFAIWGSFFALTATMLGALGAHSLKPLLSPEHLESFKTGVQYQFYHALALLLTAILAEKVPGKLMNVAGYFFIAGVFCFSGSIYLLSTREVSGLDGIGFLGPITPLGGLCFMTGWALLIIAFFKRKA